MLKKVQTIQSSDHTCACSRWSRNRKASTTSELSPTTPKVVKHIAVPQERTSQNLSDAMLRLCGMVLCPMKVVGYRELHAATLTTQKMRAEVLRYPEAETSVRKQSCSSGHGPSNQFAGHTHVYEHSIAESTSRSVDSQCDCNSFIDDTRLHTRCNTLS